MHVLYHDYDFSKAFDTVSHHKLLTKMNTVGVGHRLVNVVADFLSQRLMCVRIGNDLPVSEKKEVSVMSGVLQGSVLGPLLFVYNIGK